MNKDKLIKLHGPIMLGPRKPPKRANKPALDNNKDMRAIFQAWGSVGGTIRAMNLTPERRSAIARKAAKAREAYRAKKKRRAA